MLESHSVTEFVSNDVAYDIRKNQRWCTAVFNRNYDSISTVSGIRNKVRVR